MKLTSLLQLLLFAAASACAAAAQTKASTPVATSYRISGVVTSSADDSPIPHCHLTATLVPRGHAAGRQFPAPLGTFDADDHGRFSISVPSAGMWRLTASANGYVTQAYDEHESFSSGIVLTAATPTFDLRFRVSPEAIITGTVHDEAGEPVRYARVSLLALRTEDATGLNQPQARTRAMISTDDRGMYEFDDLPPGDYRVNVQAQVWYATAAQAKGFRVSESSPVDPSLDVAYPLTWYPGTGNEAEAETLTLHAGDSRQADFQLLPVPSVHLRILPDDAASANGRRIQAYPMIERISSGMNGGIVPASVQIDPQGGIDVSGLAPGRYEVRMQGPGEAMKPAIVEVAAGSSQTLDMSAPATIANVTIRVDGIPEPEADSVQVNLINPETGRNIVQGSSEGYVLSGALLRRRSAGTADHTVQVPPGRYEVVLRGSTDLYLTGITAQAATVAGRFVTLASGDSQLAVHVADGRPSLTGIAMMQGKPSAGAMVLLIPTTLGDPAGLNIVRRDQTNTDGSFDLNNVLPGQYILVAIDHGWKVNWKDMSTLRSYMIHGVPVDLTSATDRKENVEAQTP